jgi:cysteine desulfurase
MHTNNETGVQQPLEAIADLMSDAGVLFHVDASQAAGKFVIDLNSISIDLLSLSAHKFHGPKGAGCLVIRNRRRLRMQPLVFGGGQEFGLRSGTLATHQIVGLCEAMRLAASRRDTDFAHVVELKRIFLERLAAQININIHGDQQRCSPYLVNISVPGISSDALINQLSNDIAISSGAACSSGTIDSSYVLRAMGIDGDDLYGAVRIGFSRYHTRSDVLKAAEHMVAAVHRMQELDQIE